jgi:peroxiredoxin Q/BCP
MAEQRAVEIGLKPPPFTLKANTGEEISLASFEGRKNVVLYFYPKDETPGCTREACSFRDLADRFQELDTVILGVSLDATDSHTAFALKHQLPFPLLSDTDASVSKAYDVYHEKMLYGKSQWGIERTTFVIDRRGILRHIWRRVKVDRHGQEVLDLVGKELA